jgi:hypothetical protein
MLFDGQYELFLDLCLGKFAGEQMIFLSLEE